MSFNWVIDPFDIPGYELGGVISHLIVVATHTGLGEQIRGGVGWFSDSQMVSCLKNVPQQRALGAGGGKVNTKKRKKRRREKKRKRKEGKINK